MKQQIQRLSANPASNTEAQMQFIVPVEDVRTVEEVRQARLELEQLINEAVRNFERRTKCPVLEINSKVSAGWSGFIVKIGI